LALAPDSAPGWRWTCGHGRAGWALAGPWRIPDSMACDAAVGGHRCAHSGPGRCQPAADRQGSLGPVQGVDVPAPSGGTRLAWTHASSGAVLSGLYGMRNRSPYHAENFRAIAQQMSPSETRAARGGRDTPGFAQRRPLLAKPASGGDCFGGGGALERRVRRACLAHYKGRAAGPGTLAGVRRPPPGLV